MRRTARAMTDHVCAWAAASPATYRASSFGEGGVDVVEVERDERRDPLVGVDLDDLRTSVWNASGRRRCPSIGHE